MDTLEASEIRVLTSSAWSCFWRHPGWVHRRDSGLSVLYDIWLWHKLRAKNGFQRIDYDMFSIQTPTISFGVRDFEPAILGSKKNSKVLFFSKRKHLGLEILSFGYIWGARQIHQISIPEILTAGGWNPKKKGFFGLMFSLESKGAKVQVPAADDPELSTEFLRYFC